MKLTDPDDLKLPHYDLHSLMQAFEQAWQQHKEQKEKENECK